MTHHETKYIRAPVHETEEPQADIINRLRALRGGIPGGVPLPAAAALVPHASAPPRSRLWHAIAANRAGAGPGPTPTLPNTDTAQALYNAPLPAPPARVARTTLVGSNYMSLIVAVIQGPAGVGPVLVQTELPVVQTVPTWGNLFRCVQHKEGQVLDAIRAVGSMDAMTIAVADVPLPLLAVIGGTPSPGVNFRVLGLHPAALGQRLHPVPHSPQTMDLLVRHQQPPNTPVFVVYMYGEASIPVRIRLAKMTNSPGTEPAAFWRCSTRARPHNRSNCPSSSSAPCSWFIYG